MVVIQTPLDIDEVYAAELGKITKWVENYNEMASNWILESVDSLTIKISRVKIKRGGAGAVTLPSIIKQSRCVINLEECPTNDCFMYAVLARIHYQEFRHRERIPQYRRYVNKFDFSVLTFPVDVIQLQKFERANKGLAVWAHYFVNGSAELAYRYSLSESPITIHLLLHDDHWLPITNLNALYRKGRVGEFFKCEKCFKSFL